MGTRAQVRVSLVNRRLIVRAHRRPRPSGGQLCARAIADLNQAAALSLEGPDVFAALADSCRP